MPVTYAKVTSKVRDLKHQSVALPPEVEFVSVALAFAFFFNTALAYVLSSVPHEWQ
jgi:hypothetical protein